MGTNEREDWGVTCAAGTEGVGFAKIERLLTREEEDALGTDMGLPGKEGCEEATEWWDTWERRESALSSARSSSW